MDRYRVRPIQSTAAFIVNADGPGYAAEKYCREFRGMWAGDETESFEVRNTTTEEEYRVMVSCIVTKEFVGSVTRRA